MVVLNFAPLLIWALGLLWLNYISKKWTATYFKWDYEKLEKYTKENGEAFATLWWIGVLFFLFVGLISFSQN